MTTTYIVRLSHLDAALGEWVCEDLDITKQAIECSQSTDGDVELAALCLWEDIAEANPGKDTNFFYREAA